MVFVAGGVGVCYWYIQSQAKPTADELYGATQQTSGASNVSRHTTGSQHTSGLSIQGDLQDQRLGSSGASNAPGTPNTQSTTPSGGAAPNAQGDRITLNPAEFTLYEKYKTSTGALFADTTVGTGTEATAGKKLSVNYRGWLTNGTIFDQNADTTKPFVFTLGEHKVIAGWEQGIAGMKTGGERLIIIPPSAGYGSIAQGPIPADSVLIFLVKLLAVQ